MKNSRTSGIVILVVLAAVLAAISIFAFAYAGARSPTTYPTTNTSGTSGYHPNGIMGDWSGMMSGMMGGYWGSSSGVQTPVSATAQNTILPLIGFITLIGAALTIVGGAAYYLAVPKIRINAPITVSTIETSKPQNVVSNFVTPYASVSKTLTDEERRVLDILVLHNGKYLQKYIRIETGLSRLKIHRIVSRLAERGIVTLEQSGNTNEVHLSTWLQTNPILNATTKCKDKPTAVEVAA